MIDATVYKHVLGSFPSGVTVITTLDDDGSVVRLTASAFSSLSMDPPLVLFCPNYTSDSYPVLIRQKRFAIHLLSGEQQAEAYAFAKKGKDKASGIEWSLSELGNPILAGATAVIQPGGSKRDDEVIAACNELGIAMIFTARRHFRH